jgi:hypothetical protein
VLRLGTVALHVIVDSALEPCLVHASRESSISTIPARTPAIDCRHGAADRLAWKL